MNFDGTEKSSRVITLEQKPDNFMNPEDSYLQLSTLDHASNPNRIGILSSGGLSNQILDTLKSDYSEFFSHFTYESYLTTFVFPEPQTQGDTEPAEDDYSEEEFSEDPQPKLRKQTDLHSYSSLSTERPDDIISRYPIKSHLGPPQKHPGQLEQFKQHGPHGAHGAHEHHEHQEHQKYNVHKWDNRTKFKEDIDKPLSFKERALKIFRDLKLKLGLGKKQDQNILDSKTNEPSHITEPSSANTNGLNEPVDAAENDEDEQIYELRQYIFDLIQDKDIIFIVTYLDDEEDLKNTFEIINIAKKFHIFSVVITSLPRYFGKVENVRFTNKTLQKLRLTAEMVLLLPFFDAMNFKLIPDLIQELMEIIVLPGLINVDVADIKIVVKGGNVGVITFGTGQGEDRVKAALEKALSLKLLNVELGGVKKALVNVTGGPDMTLAEVEELAEQVKNRIQPGARIILGARINQEQTNKIKIFLMLGVTPMQVMVNRYANE